MEGILYLVLFLLTIAIIEGKNIFPFLCGLFLLGMVALAALFGH